MSQTLGSISICTVILRLSLLVSVRQTSRKRRQSPDGRSITSITCSEIATQFKEKAQYLMNTLYVLFVNVFNHLHRIVLKKKYFFLFVYHKHLHSCTHTHTITHAFACALPSFILVFLVEKVVVPEILLAVPKRRRTNSGILHRQIIYRKIDIQIYV